jgi:hypothetical protein
MWTRVNQPQWLHPHGRSPVGSVQHKTQTGAIALLRCLSWNATPRFTSARCLHARSGGGAPAVATVASQLLPTDTRLSLITQRLLERLPLERDDERDDDERDERDDEEEREAERPLRPPAIQSQIH